MKPHYIKEFMGTKSVLMKKDYDEWCFLWALIRLVYPQDRHTHYKKLRDKYLSKFDLRGITAPLTFKSISRLHKQNPWLDATFVFVYTDPAHKKTPYTSIGKGQNFYSFLFTKTNITEQTVDLHFYALLDVDSFLTKSYNEKHEKYTKKITKNTFATTVIMPARPINNARSTFSNVWKATSPSNVPSLPKHEP